MCNSDTIVKLWNDAGFNDIKISDKNIDIYDGPQGHLGTRYIYVYSDGSFDSGEDDGYEFDTSISFTPAMSLALINTIIFILDKKNQKGWCK